MYKYLSLLILVVGLFGCSRPEVAKEQILTPFLKIATTKIDSQLLQMSIDEKIGQLLIYQPELKDSSQLAEVLELGFNNRLGGVILEGLSLHDYVLTVDTLQAIARIPLFNGTREVLSLQNQFSDYTPLPSAATINAISDDSLGIKIIQIYRDQLRHLGINLNLAHQLNVNNTTTFDKRIVKNTDTEILQYAIENINDFQSENHLSVVTNFKDFYAIEQDTTGTLNKLLDDYRTLICEGISGIHIDEEIFQIDTLRSLPPHFMKRYLDIHAGFKGLLIADWRENESFLDIAYTGVDQFIVRDSFEERFEYIRKLIDAEVFTQTDLNDKVRKVLQAKSWMGLDTLRPKIDWPMAQELMKTNFDDFEIRQMYEAGMIMLQNPNDILPFKKTYKTSFDVLEVGQRELSEFQKYFSKYAAFSQLKIIPDSDGKIEWPQRRNFRKSRLIISLNDVNVDPKRDSLFINALNQQAENNPIVILNFGDPRNLIHFDTTMAIIQNYDNHAITEQLSAQLLFGALQAKGKQPYALGTRIVEGQGIDSTAIIRLKYTVPEEVGIAAYQLVGIDAIARSAIQEKVIPGCQILVAKDGKVIYSKSFGRHDFNYGKLVQNSDLYDLASITKVASTTLGMMNLYDDKKVVLNQSLKKVLELDGKSKLKNIRIRDLLSHRSGLQANMPIASFIMYEDTTGTGCSGPFCKEQKLNYLTQVADSFYLDLTWQDSIWEDVYNLTPRKRKRYRYSDVNFNLLMKVIEAKQDKALDDYVNKTFYQPLNLDRLLYNPLQRFKKREIVPTTQEERFRRQLIHGYVHDESAALLGGVAGNAGLFGNAESLVPLFQMLLNDGSYAGRRFFNKNTVELFTKKQRGTNRGLGFDVNSAKRGGSCSPKASAATYGHTGFTGTCVWADPESDLVFIFLSNRIHPDINNRKLFRKRTRTRIHNLIYDALNTYPETLIEEETTQQVMEANVNSEN